jgi:hypothetical protein
MSKWWANSSDERRAFIAEVAVCIILFAMAGLWP